MLNRSHFFFFLLLAGALGVAGYAYHLACLRNEALQAAFAQFDVRFRAYNEKANKQARASVQQVEVAVRRNRNIVKDIQVLKQSQQLRARTRQLVDTLRAARQLWQPRTGNNSGAWFRQRPPRAATRLKKQLDGYEAYLRQFVPKAQFLTVPPGDKIPSARPGFVDFYFDDVPDAAALATLARLESEVLHYEASAQPHYAAQVSTVSYSCFGNISGFAAPETNSTPSGAIYQAKMYLCSPILGYHSMMSANGRPVPVDASGRGQVEFAIPAQRPGQPDTLRMHWQGIIHAPSATGGDTTLRLTVPYLIVKRPTP